MNLNDLRDKCHQTAADKGWHDKPCEFGTRLALIHSEVSEALEDFRNGKEINRMEYEDIKPGPFGRTIPAKLTGIPSELADVIIRVLDLCGEYDVDIDLAVKEKMKFNDSRSYRHGNKKV